MLHLWTPEKFHSRLAAMRDLYAEAFDVVHQAFQHPGEKVGDEERSEVPELAKLANFCKFLAGSFSAVSKRNFARKYAFDSIFQALQDLHTFAPLQSQNFRKKSV